MNFQINYELVGKAIADYRALGYQYIEMPWWVSHEAQYTTMPKHIRSFVINEYKSVHDGEPFGHLVGSAEQALIQRILEEKINPGLYVMAGPCFRNEPVVDDLHRQSFFKVELACVFTEGTKPERDENVLMRDAMIVHRNLVNVIPVVVSMPEGEGYDLEINGIEVGSYGRRTLNGISWIYGTGVALPRLTQAVESLK